MVLFHQARETELKYSHPAAIPKSASTKAPGLRNIPYAYTPLRAALLSTALQAAGHTVLFSLAAGFGMTNRSWQALHKGRKPAGLRHSSFMFIFIGGGVVDTTELCVCVDVSCDLLPFSEGRDGRRSWLRPPTTAVADNSEYCIFTLLNSRGRIIHTQADVAASCHLLLQCIVALGGEDDGPDQEKKKEAGGVA